MSFPLRSHFKIFQDSNSSINQWCLNPGNAHGYDSQQKKWVASRLLDRGVSRNRATFHTVALDEFGSPGSPE